jgi:DNA-binding CsgD family transcriptional regulator
MKRKRSKRKAVREDRPMLLSRRESQVVELMGNGLSRAEISDRLGVSRKCVSVFVERARGKFGLKTSLQLRKLSLVNSLHWKLRHPRLSGMCPFFCTRVTQWVTQNVGPFFSGADNVALFVQRRRCSRSEFLEARIIPKRIEHRIEPEQRGSQWQVKS